MMHNSKSIHTITQFEPLSGTQQPRDLYFLSHPGQPIYSGYGLVAYPEHPEWLIGVLIVDRPALVDPAWLAVIAATYGESQLVSMAIGGERGLLCQMQIAPNSVTHLCQLDNALSERLRTALFPLLTERPLPILAMHWDGTVGMWRSELAPPTTLPPPIRAVLQQQGYGCLAVETNIGVVHICHASDVVIGGFADRPVWLQWQLIEMPTAPLIRLEVLIYDQPNYPYCLESFLNVGAVEQMRMLNRLAGQERLYLAFYGNDLSYRYTKVIPHNEQKWQQLDLLAAYATRYWEALPPERRDFDRAKALFLQLTS